MPHANGSGFAVFLEKHGVKDCVDYPADDSSTEPKAAAHAEPCGVSRKGGTKRESGAIFVPPALRTHHVAASGGGVTALSEDKSPQPRFVPPALRQEFDKQQNEARQQDVQEAKAEYLLWLERNPPG